MTYTNGDKGTLSPIEGIHCIDMKSDGSRCVKMGNRKLERGVCRMFFLIVSAKCWQNYCFVGFLLLEIYKDCWLNLAEAF